MNENTVHSEESRESEDDFMSEKDILDKIEKSAAQKEIPESIHPEKMKRKLKENQKSKVKRRSGVTYYGAVAAAVLVLVIGAAGGIHAVTGGGTGFMTVSEDTDKAASGQKSDEGSEGRSELKDGVTAGAEKNTENSQKNVQKKMRDLCIQLQKIMVKCTMRLNQALVCKRRQTG